jgi:hypothetical protein
MASEVIRKHIALLSRKQEKEFEKFQHDAGYSTFSHMIRDSIIKNRKKFYSEKSEETEKLQDMMSIFQDTMVKKFDSLNERVELIAMRINREGINSKVGHAMKDILNLVFQRDMDHSEILLKCKKYDDKTLDTALSLLLDADMIGTKNKKNKKRGEKNI